jgi:hypothetical protein
VQLGFDQYRFVPRATSAVTRSVRALVIAVFVAGVGLLGVGAWRPGADEPDAPSAQQLAAERSAHELLHGALATGTFGPREREEFRLRFRQLTRLQRASVAQRLSAAMNAGKLRLDPREMPF